MVASGKKRMKDAVAAGKKPEQEVEAILKETFLAIGVDGDYGCQYLKNEDNFKSEPSMAFNVSRFSDFQAMICDEATMTQEEFEAKIMKMREEHMKKMQEQQHGHSHGPGGTCQHSHGAAPAPAMDPEARKRIIEAARLAQQQMASMTPAQRAVMARAAQTTLASIRTATPGLSPAEMSRMVSDKMLELQRLVADHGFGSPELTAALGKLNIAIDEHTSSVSSAAAVPSASSSFAGVGAGAGAGGPASSVADGVEEELQVRVAVDRS